MDQYDRQAMRIQQEQLRELKRIADALEDLVRMNKHTKHCFVIHSDDVCEAYVTMTRNNTKGEDLLSGNEMGTI